MAYNSTDKMEDPKGRGEKRLRSTDRIHTPAPALSPWTSIWAIMRSI